MQSSPVSGGWSPREEAPCKAVQSVVDSHVFCSCELQNMSEMYHQLFSGVVSPLFSGAVSSTVQWCCLCSVVLYHPLFSGAVSVQWCCIIHCSVVLYHPLFSGAVSPCTVQWCCISTVQWCCISTVQWCCIIHCSVVLYLHCSVVLWKYCPGVLDTGKTSCRHDVTLTANSFLLFKWEIPILKWGISI